MRLSRWLDEISQVPHGKEALEALRRTLALATEPIGLVLTGPSNGTWCYADSEGQAVEEENIFRAQLAEKNGMAEVSERAGIDGVRVWNPGGLLVASD